MQSLSSYAMQQSPQKTVLNSEVDASIYGFYASLAAGGFLLAYAIYYVTIVNVTTDYAYLTLGISTGILSILAIVFHEWRLKNKGGQKDENVIEEYIGGAAVLMASLSAIWLSRFAVFYLGKEINFIEIQEEPIWIPIWLSLLQTIALLFAMEISTRMIIRHSLGTLSRTILILAPISLSFSAISIWLDYSNGELEIFLTSSFLLLISSSILYSLRLNRSALYLFSSGMGVALPIYLSTIDYSFASLLVPVVILIGITATDRSLSREMVERGSGVVVAAILFTQLLASANDTTFNIANIFESPHPFNLVFWLWAALLIGWFVPTAMVRTPAMPIALGLSLALLSDEAAILGWFVGIIAFIYLATRPQARSWVIRSTYAAMILSWYISSAIGAELQIDLFTFYDFTVDSISVSSMVLFPILLLIGIWGEKKGILTFFDGPNLLLIAASLNMTLMQETNLIYPMVIIIASLFQCYNFTIKNFGQDIVKDSISVQTIPIILVILLDNNTFEINLIFTIILISNSILQYYNFKIINLREEFDTNVLALLILLPIVFVTMIDNNSLLIFDIKPLTFIAALSIYIIYHFSREENKNMILRSEFTIILILLAIFSYQNISNWNNPTMIVNSTLSIILITAILLLLEGGAIRKSTPVERLLGIIYLFFLASTTSLILTEYSNGIFPLIIHDVLVLLPPLIVSSRLKILTDLSQEARNYGTFTLLTLLLIGLTDVSGGFLAIPVFILVVQRATKHVSTPILILLPIFAISYATTFAYGTTENALLWPWLENITYLGDNSELLGFQTPRWTSLLLFLIPSMVLYYLSDEKNRVDGSRYGPEQLFGPLVAVFFGISFLLPDDRLAPIFIVITFTYGSWKYGILGWFWVTPIATSWAMLNLISLIQDNSGILDTDLEFSAIIGGCVGLIQFMLIKTKILYSNVKNIQLLDPSFDYLGLTSRLMAYCLFLVSGDIGELMPFLISLIIGLDAFLNRQSMIFYLSILAQYFTLSAAIDNYEISSIIPISVGIIMIYMSWIKYNPFSEKSTQINNKNITFQQGSGLYSANQNHDYDVIVDFEKNLGLVGSLFTILFIIPFSSLLEIASLNQSLFGLTLILISAHHMILGFQRDQGWRRMFSLFGLPIGFVFTGTIYSGLILVMMLFLAALTLIGQALLYSSRGGLEIGSTIEGASSIISTIGLPDEISSNFELDYDTPDIEKIGIESKDKINIGQNVTNDEDEKMIDIKSKSFFISSVSDFKIKLDESLISKTQLNINTAYESFDSTKWSPILVINSDGGLLLEWEKKNN